MKKDIVYLALSGGVDSAVAGALLLEQGYDVRGVFLKIWSDEDEKTPGVCPWVEERKDALAVAAKLGIPMETLDFEEEYRKDVFSYFVSEYEAGRTPNPDILCNTVIKFGTFLDWALKQGGDYIATGHHVRRSPEDGNSKEMVYHLLAGVDDNKDQSYFLAGLNQFQLQHTLFPIGQYTKDQVRQMAADRGLDVVAEKRSTRGICFVGKVNLQDFIGKYKKGKEGNVLNQVGEVIGTHEGVQFYTIGQRHGFTVTKKGPEDGAYYVTNKDPKNNTLTVTNDAKDPALFEKEIIVADIHWLDGRFKLLPYECSARIRYRQELVNCTIQEMLPEISGKEGQRFKVVFEKDMKAVASGQVMAFYLEDELMGSAIIA